jgi:cyclopropane fatty-acyl-phospholipid synthase-like methyltransferase
MLPESVKHPSARFPPLNYVRRKVGLKITTYRPHDEFYSEDYYVNGYESIRELHERSCDVIAQSVKEYLNPATVLEVGCGNGALLAALSKYDLCARGVENSAAALRLCHERGLMVDRLDLESITETTDIGVHDVVISVEVAEHLPETSADMYVDLLCRSTGKLLIFTAATPGQGGVDHVNEQPYEYWIEKFEARGKHLNRSLSGEWSSGWERKAICTWYSENLMIFD